MCVHVTCFFVYIYLIFFPFSLFHFFFFFNDTATTEIYTLSLHDALPISMWGNVPSIRPPRWNISDTVFLRSEEHTSELQSQSNLVCRLLLEKKKNKLPRPHSSPHCTCVDLTTENQLYRCANFLYSAFPTT